MQKLRDKLAVSERTAKAEAQLKVNKDFVLFYCASKNLPSVQEVMKVLYVSGKAET